MQVEVDAETGEPFDTMTPVAIDWCRSVGCNLTKVSDIIDYSTEKVLIMAALCNSGAIIFLPGSFFLLLLLLLLSFFPRLISAAVDWMSAILLHMAWP